MLNIDKKVYRNIQEQVSWLTTTVGEIIDLTDLETLEGYVNQLAAWSDQMTSWGETMADYANTMNGYANTMNGYANTMNGYANTMAGYASQVDTWTNNISTAALAAISGHTIAPLNVYATGDITADSIIENMTGYTFSKTASDTTKEVAYTYAGVVKNGNKITFSIAGTVKRLDNITGNTLGLGVFSVPQAVAEKLLTSNIGGVYNVLSFSLLQLNKSYFESTELNMLTFRESRAVYPVVYGVNADLETNTLYYFRYEVTFLLSENLAS